MATKTFAQLGVETTVEDDDLFATYRDTGPLKQLKASIVKAYVQPTGVFLADGSVPMTGALEATTGSVSLPGYTFDGDPNTGLYSAGADQVGLSAAGVQRVGASAIGGWVFRQVLAKSSAYTAVKADCGALFLLTTTFVFSLDTPSVNTSGWNCGIRNIGTGVVTLIAAGGLINGRTLLFIYPGEGFAISTNGTAYYTEGRAETVMISDTTTLSTSTGIELLTGFDDTEFTSYRLNPTMLGASGGSYVQISLRFSGAYTSNHAYALNTIISGAQGVTAGSSAAGIKLYPANNNCGGIVEIVDVLPSASNRGPFVNVNMFGGSSATSSVGGGNAGGVTTRVDGVTIAYDTGSMIAGQNVKLFGTRGQ